MEDEEQRLMLNLRAVTGAITSYSKALEGTNRALEQLHKRISCQKAAIPVYMKQYKYTANGHTPEIGNPVSIHQSLADAEAFPPPTGYAGHKKVTQYWAVPPVECAPDSFSEYFVRLSRVFDKLMSKYHLIEQLNLKNRREDV